MALFLGWSRGGYVAHLSGVVPVHPLGQDFRLLQHILRLYRGAGGLYGMAGFRVHDLDCWLRGEREHRCSDGAPAERRKRLAAARPVTA